MRIVNVAHPDGKVLCTKNSITTNTACKKPNAAKQKPKIAETSKGLLLKATIPFIPNLSIFNNEYLLLPPPLFLTVYVIPVLLKPTQAKSPLRKRFRSLIWAWNTFATRREINRKSAALSFI